jgi:hypothetical protein
MITDRAVMEEIQYTMIEPPDLGQTWPSGLWTTAEVVGYLNQRQYRFLKDTHLQIGTANIPAVAGTLRYTLPDDWIATARVVWIALDGSTKELARSDTWEMDHGIPTWPTVSGTPKVYTDGNVPGLTLQIAPVPDANGTLQIYYVPYSALLDASGELMTVPDECVPAIKYGAMADMFGKVGRATDPRSEYCQNRYKLGIDVANLLLRGWKQ